MNGEREKQKFQVFIFFHRRFLCFISMSRLSTSAKSRWLQLNFFFIFSQRCWLIICRIFYDAFFLLLLLLSLECLNYVEAAQLLIVDMLSIEPSFNFYCRVNLHSYSIFISLSRRVLMDFLKKLFFLLFILVKALEIDDDWWLILTEESANEEEEVGRHIVCDGGDFEPCLMTAGFNLICWLIVQIDHKLYKLFDPWT